MSDSIFTEIMSVQSLVTKQCITAGWHAIFMLSALHDCDWFCCSRIVGVRQKWFSHCWTHLLLSASVWYGTRKHQPISFSANLYSALVQDFI